MNLKELIEFEETNNDEELNEGLKFFKKSKQFSKYADKLELKLSKSKMKGRIKKEDAKELQDVILDIRVGAKEFSRVEDKFRDRKFTRKEAKVEINKLKEKYKELNKKVNSERFKKIAKVIGAAAVVTSVGLLLNQFFSPSTMYMYTASGGMTGSGNLGEPVATITGKSGAQRLADRIASSRSE